MCISADIVSRHDAPAIPMLAAHYQGYIIAMNSWRAYWTICTARLRSRSGPAFQAGSRVGLSVEAVRGATGGAAHISAQTCLSYNRASKAISRAVIRVGFSGVRRRAPGVWHKAGSEKHERPIHDTSYIPCVLRAL